MRLLIKIFLLLATITANGQGERISKILGEIDSKEHLSGVVLVGQGGQISIKKLMGQQINRSASQIIPTQNSYSVHKADGQWKNNFLLFDREK